MKRYSLIFLWIFIIYSLKPGTKIRNFKLHGVKYSKNSNLDKVNYDLISNQYQVLIFYPFDFTFVCPTELWAFSNNMEKFNQLGVRILGVSTDSLFSHHAWLKTSKNNGGLEGLEFPLISDFSKKITKYFEFLVEESENELEGAALRGLVIIDKKNIIKHIQINDGSVGRSVDEVIRLIEAFQFVEKNGVVCPANWRPGRKSMKTNEESKRDYFSEM